MNNIKLCTCEICGFTTENGRIMSNHKRWKHIMPKNSETYTLFTTKMSSIKKEDKIEKLCICKKCGKEFKQAATEHNWNIGNIKLFCSRSCANSRGPRTEDFKQKVRIKRRRNDKICPICGVTYNSRSNTCSRHCGNLLRYKDRLKDIKYYRSKCKFNFALSKYPNEFDFEIIKKYGWYSPANSKKPNLNGVSRDHMVSIKYGFEHNIDPKIIAHPANCRIILQNDNASKYSDCCITYEQLLERIKIWDSKYNK